MYRPLWCNAERAARTCCRMRLALYVSGSCCSRLLLLCVLQVKILLCLLVSVLCLSKAASRHLIAKRNYSDQSVRGYLTERTCWWNEVCKEEFHSKFRCRCPRWSYCRAPGRYYDAHCSITHTGYIWTQPETSPPADSPDK